MTQEAPPRTGQITTEHDVDEALRARLASRKRGPSRRTVVLGMGAGVVTIATAVALRSLPGESGGGQPSGAGDPSQRPGIDPTAGGNQYPIDPNDLNSLRDAFLRSPSLQARFSRLLGGDVQANVPALAQQEQTPVVQLIVDGNRARSALLTSFDHVDGPSQQDWWEDGFGMSSFPGLLPPRQVQVDPSRPDSGSVVSYIRDAETSSESGLLAVDIFANHGQYGQEVPENARYLRLIMSVTPEVSSVLNQGAETYIAEMDGLVRDIVNSGALGPITTPTELPPQ